MKGVRDYVLGDRPETVIRSHSASAQSRFRVVPEPHLCLIRTSSRIVRSFSARIFQDALVSEVLRGCMTGTLTVSDTVSLEGFEGGCVHRIPMRPPVWTPNKPDSIFIKMNAVMGGDNNSYF